jgi:membrane-bound lytic murein transglycosylase C
MFAGTMLVDAENSALDSITQRLAYKELPKNESSYRFFTEKVAKNYGIDPLLAMAIMKVESAFNPYAVSETGALGLMQLKMDQAIEDVYVKVYGINSIPSPSNFFEPELNIEVGVAYIWLMSNRYFQNITNQKSKEYCMIAGYNAGAGAVLRTFDADKLKAQEIINSLSPEKVLYILKTKLDNMQGRRYIVKVMDVLQKESFAKYRASNSKGFLID